MRTHHACSATANDDHLLPFIFSHWLGCHALYLISRTGMYRGMESSEVSADERNGQKQEREGEQGTTTYSKGVWQNIKQYTRIRA